MSLNRPPCTPWTDHSGTILAGGTAQQLMPVNNGRIGVFIHNLDATEDLTVKPNSTNGTDAAIGAVGTIVIPAKTTLLFSSYADPGLWSIVATTTGHKFTAKEWGV